MPGEGVPHRDARSTHFYNMERINRGFVVRNCTFRPQRRHAVLVRGVDGVIEGNTIDGVGGGAVSMGNEQVHFYEGPFPRNNVIRNNTIRNCRVVPIAVYTHTIGPSARLTRDIVIEKNVIELRPGQETAIRLRNVENVALRGNTITDADGRPLGDAAVAVQASEEITIE